VENPILLLGGGAGLMIVATVLALVQEVTVDKKKKRTEVRKVPETSIQVRGRRSTPGRGVVPKS
jgi:hypothetical protein